jgi:integrase
MPRKLPKYVRSKTAKGKTYLYFDTGAVTEGGKAILKRLPGLRDPTFGRALSAAESARERRDSTPHVLTVATLANLYEKSQEFARLAPASQINYGTYLKAARERLGIAPAADVNAEDVRIIRDKMADRPGAANMFVRTLGSLYSWGRKRGHVQNNPVRDVDLLDQGEHEPWPEWLLLRALDDPDVRLPVSMLYYTAQRIGDVCRMRWSDVRAGAIELKQQKTGLTLTVPIHRELSALIGQLPRTSLTILVGPTGGPWTPHTLRRLLQAWAAAQGAQIVPHGLRKNAVNALLEAGCSSAETAAISGQTLQVIEHYAKRRDTRVLGKAAILRWEGQNKSGNGKQK